MMDCNKLKHPFQNDGGVSQRQRRLPALNPETAPVDGRSLADLLQFFTKMAPQINHFQNGRDGLAINDWQPFFQNSLPFQLAAISHLDVKGLEENWRQHLQGVRLFPSHGTLQLLVDFLYNDLIVPLARWQLAFAGTGLELERKLDAVISQNLQGPVQHFIQLTNGGSFWFCLRRLDFSVFSNRALWGLEPMTRLYERDDRFRNAPTYRHRMEALAAAYNSLFPAFMDTLKMVVAQAPANIRHSLYPLQEAQAKQHAPHLGLLFSFLELFAHIQKEMNGFSKKHLDFFLQKLLQLRPKPAVPDQAHLLFELQNPHAQFKLESGRPVLNGKDSKKQNNVFRLNNEIIVDKAMVAGVRTLYLNPVRNFENREKKCIAKSFIEGVYMAPKADAADGMAAPFPQDEPTHWPTLGAKESRFVAPGATLPKEHPPARLGFVLASPVLLLDEGRRTVTLTLTCSVNGSPCYSGSQHEELRIDEALINDAALFAQLQKAFTTTYVYVSLEAIAEAERQGLRKELIEALHNLIPYVCTATCENPQQKELVHATGSVTLERNTGPWNDFLTNMNPTVNERSIINGVFGERRVFKISFSGEESWVSPSLIEEMKIEKPLPTQCLITLKILLLNDKPAVTFYDKNILKAPFPTHLPLVSMEVDPVIKIETGSSGCQPDCCLERPALTEKVFFGKSEKRFAEIETDCTDAATQISLYHFLRDLKIEDARIDVEVCGVKNLIVQNDENIQDVNAPVHPFGTRPTIIDFDVVDPANNPVKNLVGPNFYIGSKEIFCKPWGSVHININWKNKPSDFRDYYKAYIADKSVSPVKFGLDADKFEVNISVLQEGEWQKEKLHPAITTTNPVTNSNNRQLFASNGATPLCTPPWAPIPALLSVG